MHGGGKLKKVDTKVYDKRQTEVSEWKIQEITEYIDVFYNRPRLQRQLDYLSPAAFERRYHEQRLAA